MDAATFKAGWSNLRVFRLSREQWADLIGADPDGTVMYPDAPSLRLHEVLWPFDCFGIEVEDLNGVHRVAIEAPQNRPFPENVAAQWCATQPDGVWCPILSMDLIQRDGAFAFGITFSNGLGEEQEYDLCRESLWVAARLSDALMAASTKIVETKQPSKKQLRRAGAVGSKSAATYEIELRPDVTISRAADDARVNRGLKPCFPKRRHQVTAFERTRLGRIEQVRAHQRGGKPGPGPGYLLSEGLISAREDGR